MSKFLELPKETKLTSKCQERASGLIPALNDIGHTYDKFMEIGSLDRKSIDNAHEVLKHAEERHIINSEEVNSVLYPLGEALANENWRSLHEIHDKPKFVSLFGEDTYKKTQHIGGAEIEQAIKDAEQTLLATLLEKVATCEYGEKRE